MKRNDCSMLNEEPSTSHSVRSKSQVWGEIFAPTVPRSLCSVVLDNLPLTVLQNLAIYATPEAKDEVFFSEAVTIANDDPSIDDLNDSSHSSLASSPIVDKTNEFHDGISENHSSPRMNHITFPSQRFSKDSPVVASLFFQLPEDMGSLVGFSRPLRAMMSEWASSFPLFPSELKKVNESGSDRMGGLSAEVATFYPLIFIGVPERVFGDAILSYMIEPYDDNDFLPPLIIVSTRDGENSTIPAGIMQEFCRSWGICLESSVFFSLEYSNSKRIGKGDVGPWDHFTLRSCGCSTIFSLHPDNMKRFMLECQERKRLCGLNNITWNNFSMLHLYADAFIPMRQLYKERISGFPKPELVIVSDFSPCFSVAVGCAATRTMDSCTQRRWFHTNLEKLARKLCPIASFKKRDFNDAKMIDNTRNNDKDEKGLASPPVKSSDMAPYKLLMQTETNSMLLANDDVKKNQISKENYTHLIFLWEELLGYQSSYYLQVRQADPSYSCPIKNGNNVPEWKRLLPLSTFQRTVIIRFLRQVFSDRLVSLCANILQCHGMSHFLSFECYVNKPHLYDIRATLRSFICVEVTIGIEGIIKWSSTCHQSFKRRMGFHEKVLKQLERSVLPNWKCNCTPWPHQRSSYTSSGKRICRHIIQVLIWFFQYFTFRKCLCDTGNMNIS